MTEMEIIQKLTEYFAFSATPSLLSKIWFLRFIASIFWHVMSFFFSLEESNLAHILTNTRRISASLISAV